MGIPVFWQRVELGFSGRRQKENFRAWSNWRWDLSMRTDNWLKISTFREDDTKLRNFISMNTEQRQESTQQVDYRRFERTVNHLLSEVTHNRKDIKFELRTDPGSKIVLPGCKKKVNSGVEILTRDDGSVSRPDAVLHGTCSLGEIVIVCDAKYYTNEVPEKVILKTLDDMRLRGTPYGILICS